MAVDRPNAGESVRDLKSFRGRSQPTQRGGAHDHPHHGQPPVREGPAPGVPKAAGSSPGGLRRVCGFPHPILGCFTGTSQPSRRQCGRWRRASSSSTTSPTSPTWWPRPCATRASRSRWRPTAARPSTRWRPFRPQLLVLDVMLPDLDGFEVMRRLQRRRPEGAGAVPHRPRRHRGQGARASPWAATTTSPSRSAWRS